MFRPKTLPFCSHQFVIRIQCFKIKTHRRKIPKPFNLFTFLCWFFCSVHFGFLATPRPLLSLSLLQSPLAKFTYRTLYNKIITLKLNISKFANISTNLFIFDKIIWDKVESLFTALLFHSPCLTINKGQVYICFFFSNTFRPLIQQPNFP